MKNALKKLILTDTDTQPEVVIPQWKDDEDFKRWTDKAQSIAQQLDNAKAEQRENQAKIEEGQAAVVQARSAVILEEGSEKDLQEAEASLAANLERDVALTLEVKALDAAHARADQESKAAGELAKESARAIILPLYQEKIKAIVDSLNIAMAANADAEAFEKLVGQSGLSLNHGIMGSPFTLHNLNLPLGLPEYQKTVEGLLNKTKL